MKKTGQGGKAHLEIFKVQCPITTSDPNVYAQFYNEDRSCTFEWPATSELIKRMKGQLKDFFWITWTERKDGSIDIDIHHRAPWQEW